MIICILLIGFIKSNKDHALHKHDHEIEKYKKRYKKNLKRFLYEEKNDNPTTILIWWAPLYPMLEKIPEACGGCWLTHQKRLEKQASGVVYDIDNFE